MKQRWLSYLLVLSVLLLSLWLARNYWQSYLFEPTGNNLAQTGLNALQLSQLSDEGTNAPTIEVVAEDLEIPWEIAFLPDSSLLVTERPGRLVRLYPGSREIVLVSGVAHVGEGGLLGLALHPDFETNGWLYLYLTTRTSGALTNRVERYRFNQTNNSLSGRLVIIENIPGAQFHDGGRLAFGPDNLLYITTGDAGQENSAQAVNSLAGKILRLTADGGIPADNPFSNAVYSYGHRNPQGIAWDSQGRLWSSEHGPSGAQTGNDEVNLITAGSNYGWPAVRGSQTRSGMVSPVIESGRSDTWAPGDAEVVDDLVFFTGLRGEALYTARLVGDQLMDLTAHFVGEYGRLRAVTIDPTGEWLYLTTSNTDGRGTVRAGDDKIIRINKDLFF
jgi:glucose/arabinose dehydrogenase